MTSSKIEAIIKNGSGRIENSTTFQGHSLAIAAAYGVQSLIHEDGFVEEVDRKGILFRSLLTDHFKDHEFFKNVRGRGVRNTMEISCENEHLFGLSVTERMKNEHGIIINGN